MESKKPNVELFGIVTVPSSPDWKPAIIFNKVDFEGTLYNSVDYKWHFYSLQKLSLNSMMTLNLIILCTKLKKKKSFAK